MVSACYQICREPGKSHFCRAWTPHAQIETAGFLPPFRRLSERSDQRKSCSTLACDWLASASAETAIDWRVASAWLLAASSLVSASVRFDAPVCSTLMRFLLKS